MSTTRATRPFRRSERWSRCRLRTRVRHSPPPARRSGEHRWARPFSTRPPTSSSAIPNPSSRSVAQLSERSRLIDDIQRRGVPDHIDFTSIGASEDWVVPATNISLRGARRDHGRGRKPEPGRAPRRSCKTPTHSAPCARRSRGVHRRVSASTSRCAARSHPWSSVAPRISSGTQRPATFREEPHEAQSVRLRSRHGGRARSPDAGSTGHEQVAGCDLVERAHRWAVGADHRRARRRGRHRCGAGARPRLRRHHAMGGEGRRRRKWATRRSAAMSCSSARPDVSSPSGAATARSAGSRRWTATSMRSHWPARTRSPATPVAPSGRSTRRVVGSCGLPTTRASSGRRRRSTLLPRSSSRSGTKNRHPPLAPSTSPPVRCAGSTRSGCTPLRPGWITGARSSRRATATTTRGLPPSTSMPESPSGPSRCPRRSRSGVVPASDGRDLVVVDQIGRVTAFDPVAGAVRWTRALNRNVIDSRVVLFARRVVVTTLRGELFVLDRVSGRVVAHADGRDFDGIPVLVAPTRRPNRMLVTIRLTQPGRVEMRRVP